MEKILYIGDVNLGYKKANSKIFCKVKIEEPEYTYRGIGGWNKKETKPATLSISGVIGPRKSGNADGSCGQIDMDFWHRDGKYRDDKLIKPKDIKFSEGWDAIKWLDFLDVWENWHLNDLTAGCEHQIALGWDSYDEHPSEPCPTCGYKYGTAWKTRRIPDRVINFLEALPESKIKPTWV
ncbi:MAG: hypothetical protein IPM48_14440 [Saprospiraceae bacterium]|nr:hypothetical protein [Saprospiraceae bacterium]